MKIAYISTIYNGGGAERCARELSIHFSSGKHTALMFVATRRENDPPNVKSIRLPGEKYLRIGEIIIKRPIDWLRLGSYLLINELKKNEIDVVHFHNIHGSWLSLRIAQKIALQFPTVWTLHDEWAVTPGLPYDFSRVYNESDIEKLHPEKVLHSSHPRAIKLRNCIQSFLPTPSVIVSPSSYILELAKKSPWFFSSKFCQRPYGVKMLDLDSSNCDRKEAKEMFGLAKDQPVILLVANMLGNIYKGMHYSIDVINQLKNNVQVLVIGNGGQELIRQLNKPCIYAGFISNDNHLAKAYRAADVTLMTSVADNFPYVALESLACETPIACFGVGGMPEIAGYGKFGLCAEPFAVDKLAVELTQLLADASKRAMMGKLGQEWASTMCNPRDYFNWYETCYESARFAFSSKQFV